jgi:shikimate kinase
MKSIISLWGMMGVGKTHWGKVLAKRYGMPHLDLDDYMVAVSGITVQQWFESSGERLFRAFEKDCVQGILETFRDQPLVLSLGGGTPCFNQLDTLLSQQTLSIFLYEEAKVLKDRLLTSSQVRPLLQGKKGKILLEKLIEMECDRNPIYEKASFKVKSDENALTELCKIIEKHILDKQ